MSAASAGAILEIMSQRRGLIFLIFCVAQLAAIQVIALCVTTRLNYLRKHIGVDTLKFRAHANKESADLANAIIAGANIIGYSSL